MFCLWQAGAIMALFSGSLHVSALPSRGLLLHSSPPCSLQTVSREGQDKWSYILIAAGQNCTLIAAWSFFQDSDRNRKKSLKPKGPHRHDERIIGCT